MSKGGFMKDALILFAITLVSGAALGAVYEVTKEPIAAAEIAAKADAYRAVLPEAAEFKNDLADKLTAANEAIAGLGYGNVTVDEAVSGLDASGAAAGSDGSKGIAVTSGSLAAFGVQTALASWLKMM